jgi:small-conductance mechanosensitive channel
MVSEVTIFLENLILLVLNIQLQNIGSAVTMVTHGKYMEKNKKNNFLASLISSSSIFFLGVLLYIVIKPIDKSTLNSVGEIIRKFFLLFFPVVLIINQVFFYFNRKKNIKANGISKFIAILLVILTIAIFEFFLIKFK